LRRPSSVRRPPWIACASPRPTCAAPAGSPGPSTTWRGTRSPCVTSSSSPSSSRRRTRGVLLAEEVRRRPRRELRYPPRSGLRAAVPRAAVPGGLHEEPRHPPAAEVEALADEGLLPEQEDPAGGRFVDREGSRSVPREHERAVAGQQPATDVERGRLRLDDEVEEAPVPRAQGLLRVRPDGDDPVAGAGVGGAVLELVPQAPRRGPERARPGEGRASAGSGPVIGPLLDRLLP